MKIFVTRKIPKPGLELLRKEHEIEVNPHDRVLTKDEIIKGLKGKDGLLCLLTDLIDEEVIKSEPNLRMIASYAVGYDNIDVLVGATDFDFGSKPDIGKTYVYTAGSVIPEFEIILIPILFILILIAIIRKSHRLPKPSGSRKGVIE